MPARKRYLLIGVPVLLMMLLAFSSWLLLRNDRIDQAHFHQLSIGMDYHQVYAVLGKPASTTDFQSYFKCSWVGRRALIACTFSNDGILMKKGYDERFVEMNYFDWLKLRLGL